MTDSWESKLREAFAPLWKAIKQAADALNALGRPRRKPRRALPKREGRHQPQPRTLHLALAANARPIHRPRQARPSQRVPACRRRN